MRLPPRLFAISLFAGVLVAQQTPGYNTGYDPPSRVARLNFLDGNVSYLPAGQDAWGLASLNYPLTTGDHVYSDLGSHAEMHIGPNALRLGSQSNFGFLNLDDRTVQVRFTQGALEVRLRRLEDDDLYEIDTPQGAISLLRNGDYRIETDPNRNVTMVTVRAGEAEVTAGGTSFAVHPRQTGFFAEGSQPGINPANPPDAFDSFVDQRNALEDRIPPPVHVPPSMVGYQDLDAYGVWRNEPAYGWVWVPRVHAGWSPYHEGHWAWVSPWGWTWIDDAPWGFAPFHYGRWANLGGVWVWAPGNVVARPVYSPAMVAFVGGGSFGVAWFPLGPHEPFIPAYRVSNAYVQQVNITHVTVTNVNVTNVRYVNQQVPGAVVAVPQAAFASARPVAAMARPVSVEEMRGTQVMASAQVAPQRALASPGGRANAVVAQPPQAIMNRPVVQRNQQPAPSAPTPAATPQPPAYNRTEPRPAAVTPRPAPANERRNDKKTAKPKGKDQKEEKKP